MRTLFPLRWVVVLLSLALAQAAAATTFPVTSPLDAVDAAPGDGTCATAGAVCTLRAAVQEANALAGADIITIPTGTYTLSIAGINENAAATGDLDVTDTLTINGSAGVTIDANAIDAVFDLQPGAYTFTVDRVTIVDGLVDPLDVKNGAGAISISQFAGTVPNVVVTNSSFVSNTGDRGGAIGVFGVGPGGNLTVVSSTFDDNHSTGDGGAIFYDTQTGSLSITDSTFGFTIGNVADGDGGAIEYVMQNNAATRTYDILRSTFVNNQALDAEGGALYYCCGTFNATIVESTIASNTSLEGGGGIYTCCGGTDELTITNSTISGNQTTDPAGDGGGIDVEGDVTLLNTTIANNTAAIGGGVSLNGGTLTTRNALLGGNTGSNCAGLVSIIVTQGGNLSSDATCASGFDAGSDRNSANPMLGPLANNGGPTRTHALLPGSAAIDNAVAGAPATDQRGVVRPIGPAADIGSFEAAAVALTPTTTTVSSSQNPSTAGQPVTFTATVAGAGGPPAGTVTFFDGVTSLGTVPLSFGSAQLTTSALTVGSHSITAQYNGNATFAGSTSAPLVQVVSAAGAPGESIPVLDARALAMLVVLLAAAATAILRRV